LGGADEPLHIGDGIEEDPARPMLGDLPEQLPRPGIGRHF